MRDLAQIYGAIWEAELKNVAQYRLQTLLWLLFPIIRPVVFLSAWTAVANAQGGNVGGYSAGDFAAYYVTLTLVSHLTMAWNNWEFEMEVRQGHLSPKLLRPLHPIHYSVVENLAYKLFPLIVLAPVLWAIGWSFGAHFTTGLLDMLLFVPSLILAAALRFVFGWVVATIAFWTTRAQVASELLDRLVFVFAGQIAPVSLLPGAMQTIAYILPFSYMLGLPADILRGSHSVGENLALLGAQAAWLAASYVLLQVLWRLGIRQYSAVGA